MKAATYQAIITQTGPLYLRYTSSMCEWLDCRVENLKVPEPED